MHQRFRLVNGIVGLLIVQFILGMLSNLYGNVPEGKPYLVFHDPSFIFFHAWNAVLLVILGITFLVKSVRRKRTVSGAVAGLAGLLIAYTCGVLFVLTEAKHDYLSFVMALGFLIAFGSYLTIAVRFRTTPKG